MADILRKIAGYKREEVDALKAETSAAALGRIAAHMPPPRGFAAAIKARSALGPALIAEIKKASPSKGLICADFDPPEIAKCYEDGGATCLSVLTDGPSFQGENGFLRAASAVTHLPVLRKDFMIDPIQIIQSRALGADAILIIMAMLDDKTAKTLLDAARDLGMDALVETHDGEEMRRAIDLGATLIGVNNRNLRTFDTSLKTFEKIAPIAPKSATLIAESGIFTSDDILHLTAQGAQGFLVGEALMRQDDVTGATEKLLGRRA